MEFSLNAKQKEILNCFFNNGVCFVNASAGTGKTSTITELYLELLRKKEKVSSIVVITFTKAAANEMLIRIRLKIRNEIKKAQSENDKKYWQNIYRDILTNAKISTINSFANSIVLEHSMALSMPPNISILEDSSEFNNRLKDEILNVLKEAVYTEKLRKLYRIYTEESKSEFADKILKFLIKIKPRLENIENFEKKALEIINIDKKEYDKLYNNIYNYSIDLLDDKSKSGKYINECHSRLSILINKLDLIKDKEKVKNLQIEEYEYIINALYNVSQAKLGNTKHDDFRALLSELQPFCETMINYVNILYNKENYITVVNFIKDTYLRFEEVKKIIGAYSYEDIMHKAIEALENENISKEIRENISTLILDEAQDTSLLQFGFINLIAFGKREIKSEDRTNKKIMIVGDRKQSIYRFRNADLNAFMKTQKIFEKNVRYLKDNYRSNSMLIDFFNEFFQQTVFIDDKIGYINEDNLLHNKKTNDKSVSILVLNNNVKEENKALIGGIEYKTELEAYSIAKYIKKYYDNDYKNVVILLQATKRLNIYLKALSDFNIPYYIDGGNGFYEREEIILIKTFLEYLILRDHAKLTILLRSDFFDIDISSLSDFLFTLLINNLDINDYFPLNVINKNNYNKILEMAKSKSYYNQLEKAKNLLNTIENKIITMNTAEAIETICTETNYYNYLMTKEDAELAYANIEKFKNIAYEFENQTGNSIYDFVLSIKNVSNDIPYSSIPKLSVEAVKIMTIHKSKGLEFDNVFVAGIGHARNPITNDFDFIEDAPLIKLPIYGQNHYKTLEFCSFNKENNKQSDSSEKKRLLYVALTRASNNLILSGECSKQSKNNSYRTYINNYCNEITDYKSEVLSEESYDIEEVKDIDNKFINIYTYGLAIKPDDKINNHSIDIEIIKKKIKNKKNNTNIKESKTRLNINPSLINNNERNFNDISAILDKKISELENNINNDADYDEEIAYISYKDMGTIIHKILEHFDFERYKKEKEIYLDKIKTDVVKSYNHYNEKQLTKNLNTAFSKLFENQHIQNIMNGNEIIISREHTFQQYNNEEKTITGNIDLITKNVQSNEYFVLDYKTSKYSKEKEDYYKPQLDTYKNMVKNVFNIEDESKISTGLIFLK